MHVLFFEWIYSIEHKTKIILHQSTKVEKQMTTKLNTAKTTLMLMVHQILIFGK